MYTVQWVTGLADEGTLDTSGLKLLLAAGPSTTRIKEAAFHESFHAAIDLTNLRGKDKDEEESMVAALSPVIFSMLRDNPEFVEWMMSP
jgi:hypothetical protein